MAHHAPAVQDEVGLGEPQEFASVHFHRLPPNWKKLAKRTSSTRSDSPGAFSETSNSYAASNSSLATSAGAVPECGFPNDENADCMWSPSCNRDEEWDTMKFPFRPLTPVDRFARRLNCHQSQGRTPSIRPSGSSRSAMSLVHDGEEANAACTDEADSDTDESGVESGCETAALSDADEDGSDDDDDEWSGQNGDLETLVVSAVGGDYSLAAFLIPHLHRDFNSALKSKVESWRCTTTARGSSDGSPDTSKSSPGGTAHSQDRASSKKRRRTSSDDGSKERDGGADDEEGENGQDEDKDHGKAGPGAPADQGLLLACPFHKQDPLKYGVHGQSGPGKKSKFRACTGPGFRSIQRLKEHLRRVHSPVQCERCKQIFPTGTGRDRAQCLTELAEHRKSETSCVLGEASLKEGIDEAQWAQIDKQNRKKNQELHRVEKWFEIWDILFPGLRRPNSPWHEISSQFRGMPTDDERYFGQLFDDVVGHKYRQGDIPLPDPATFDLDTLRERLKSAAQITFRIYVSMHENLRPLDTSSSESRRSLATATSSSHPATAATAATSVASGQPPPPRARPPPPTAYALDPPYGLGIPVAMPAQAGGSPQFMSPLGSGPGGMHPPPPPPPMHGNMAAFGGMPAEDPTNGFYFPSYMFPAPPQGPCQWIPGNHVQFQHPIPQNTALPGSDAWYFADSQGFGGEPGERK